LRLREFQTAVIVLLVVISMARTMIGPARSPLITAPEKRLDGTDAVTTYLFFIRIPAQPAFLTARCRDVGKGVPNPLGGPEKGVPLRYCFKRRRVYQLP
jgi:hypothetical protein